MSRALIKIFLSSRGWLLSAASCDDEDGRRRTRAIGTYTDRENRATGYGGGRPEIRDEFEFASYPRTFDSEGIARQPRIVCCVFESKCSPLVHHQLAKEELESRNGVR